MTKPYNSHGSDDQDALIRIDHVHKTYVMGDNHVHALRGITLGIARGGGTAIRGTSGAGKSTLMNIIG